MKTFAWLLLALAVLSGCGSAIGPAQADGSDCNLLLAEAACGAASYCDVGLPNDKGVYPRSRTYGLTGDKTHVVGTCQRKGAAGAPCFRKHDCVSGECILSGAEPDFRSKGVCK